VATPIVGLEPEVVPKQGIPAMVSGEIESPGSQSESDSEVEFIEERTRRGRSKPVPLAKPGEGTTARATTVKREPVNNGAPHWASIPDTSLVSEQYPLEEAPRWSSIMEKDVSSGTMEAVEVPRWASTEEPLGSAPRSEPSSGRKGAAGPPPGSAGPTSEQPGLITFESADGTTEEYIIKLETVSSENEAEAPPPVPAA